MQIVLYITRILQVYFLYTIPFSMYKTPILLYFHTFQKKSRTYAVSSNVRDSVFLIIIPYTIPCAVMASATFKNPAMFAPAT